MSLRTATAGGLLAPNIRGERERAATGLVSYTFCAAMAPDLATTFSDAKVMRIQNM